MIQIKISKVTINGKEVISSANLDIEPGDFTLLLGKSGVGKSTLLNACLQNNISYIGSIDYLVNGKPHEYNYVKKKGLVRLVSSKKSLIPWITVNQNLEVLHKINPFIDSITEDSKLQYLDMLKLNKNILEKYPHELSYGMKVRVKLMNSIIGNPKFIFFDEPLIGLDSVTKKKVFDLLQKAVSNKQISSLFITHNLGLINKRTYVLSSQSKKIHKISSREEVLSILASN